MTRRRWINSRSIFDIKTGRLIRRDGFWHEGEIARAVAMASFTQADYAFYEDGTESGSTIIGSVNVAQTITTDINHQCRFNVEEVGGASGDFRIIDFQFNHESAGWLDVTATSPLQYVDSANLTNGDDTTQRIGTATFTTPNAGVTEDNTIPNLTMGADEDCEFLLSFLIDSAQVTDADTIQLRLQGADTFAVTATLTVNKPAVGGGRRIFIN